MKKNLILIALLLVIAFQFGKVYAQSGAVIYLQATAGTTKAANCGTPNVPALCVVADGVWIWESAAQGWIQPLSVAGSGTVVTSLSVNGGAAQTGPVAITIPSTAVIPAQNAPLK